VWWLDINVLEACTTSIFDPKDESGAVQRNDVNQPPYYTALKTLKPRILPRHAVHAEFHETYSISVNNMDIVAVSEKQVTHVDR
jgi:hypothetical protein